MHKNLIDLSGAVFGSWTVVAGPLRIGRHIAWQCECVCGRQRTVIAYSLRNGASQSCGCVPRPPEKKTAAAGRMRIPEYRSWLKMRARCRNPNDAKYRLYGARGISIDDRWESFATFLIDMGPRPPGTTLDRIDVNGNYEPGNCRWATALQQSRNTRAARPVLRSDGVRFGTMAEAAEASGLPAHAIAYALRKKGKSAGAFTWEHADAPR